MTELLARKRHGAFRPEDDDDHSIEVFARIPEGARVLIDAKDTRRRSNREHAFWFAILTQVWTNSEAIQKQCGNFEAFRKLVLIELGYFDAVKKRDGEVVKIARSVAFHKMGESEFNKLVSDTLDLFEGMGFDPVELRQKAAA